MNKTFLSCDWGTTSFRLRLVAVEPLGVVTEVASDEGIAPVFERWQQQTSGEKNRTIFYKAVLRNYIIQLETALGTSLQNVAVVISGMASSSIGMMELPYKPLPFSVAGTDLYVEKMKSSAGFEHDILLVSGVRSDRDVMRGEETQLSGCNVEARIGQQVFIFPGTHSKHIFVENGKVTGFKTYMTGEFFHLLSANSILSNSVSSAGNPEETANLMAFDEGISDSRYHHLLHACFLVRTNHLFSRFSKEQNYWYLSGLVIGSEVNDLLKKEVQHITVVSEGKVAAMYQRAFHVPAGERLLKITDVNEALIKAHKTFFVNHS